MEQLTTQGTAGFRQTCRDRNMCVCVRACVHAECGTPCPAGQDQTSHAGQATDLLRVRVCVYVSSSSPCCMSAVACALPPSPCLYILHLHILHLYILHLYILHLYILHLYILHLYMPQVYGKYYRKLSKRVQTALAEANAVAEEVLSAMTTVGLRVSLFFGWDLSRVGVSCTRCCRSSWQPKLNLCGCGRTLGASSSSMRVCGTKHAQTGQ